MKKLRPKEGQILIDPNNLDSMINIMDNYNHYDMLFGHNDKGEDTRTSIFTDKIVVSTNQSNGWVRVNTYYRDGGVEEDYDGRWK